MESEHYHDFSGTPTTLELSAAAAEVAAETSKEPAFLPDLALKIAVEEFEKSFHDRSFAGRNAHLGKMIKCDGCGHRHRSSIVCERNFAKFEDGTPRVVAPSRHRHRARSKHDKRYF